MTDVERALAYLRIFVGVGPAWRNFVPVDASVVTAHSVRIGDCEVGPNDDYTRWWLKDLTAGTTSWYQRVVTS